MSTSEHLQRAERVLQAQSALTASDSESYATERSFYVSDSEPYSERSESYATKELYVSDSELLRDQREHLLSSPKIFPMTYRFMPFGIILFLLLSACTPKVVGVLEPPTASQPFEFIIVQMNDVYEIAPLEGGKSAGLARVATVIKELKAENPNTISVIAGDFLSPSFMGNLKMENGEKIAGLQMVETLNAIGLDYATYGNHEFDISDLALLQKRFDAGTFRYMSSNVRKQVSRGYVPFTQKINGKDVEVPDYITHTFQQENGQSLRLAIVGTTLPFNQQDYIHYLDWKEAFVAAVAEAAEQAEVVVGLTHLNMDQDQALAALNLPIPLIMGGHEHVQQSSYIEQTAIAKADANARTIYVHRFSYDPCSGKANFRSTVVPITDAIVDDPAVKAIVDQWQSKTATAISEMGYDPNRVIYNAATPLEGTEAAVRSRQTNYGQLTTAAFQAAWSGADVYLLNGGSLRVDDDLQGDITEYDILRSFPFGGNIVQVELPGEVLKEVLQTGRFTNLGEGGYLQVSGAKLQGDQWLVNDQSIVNTQTYKVVLPAFMAAGKEANLGVFGDYTPSERDQLRIGNKSIRNDIRDILIAYLPGL